jgi:LmbE family N-acetylglucosaminyl deacetylase
MDKKSLVEKQTVLVIVAHTDDEVLGAGGSIAKHSATGDVVYAVAMTDGVSARGVSHTAKKYRYSASKRAAEILGFTWLANGGFEDNEMDATPLLRIVQFIETIKKEISPDIIYTQCGADLNIDHRIVNQATLTAFRPIPDEDWTEIRAFEVPSATDYGHRSLGSIFCPNLFIDITEFFEKKMAALAAYQDEMRESPSSRSYEGIENMAKYRGNQAGVFYAEAFEILRKIIR